MKHGGTSGTDFFNGKFFKGPRAKAICGVNFDGPTIDIF